MKTLQAIFAEIKNLNVEYHEDMTELRRREQMAEIVEKNIRGYIPAGSLAAKIMGSSSNFSEKQLWVIAYELERNGYGKRLEDIEARAAATEARQKAAKSRRNAVKKQAKQAIEETEKENASYTAGTEVSHCRYGKGIVKTNDGDKITVTFADGMEKIFVAKFVKFA